MVFRCPLAHGLKTIFLNPAVTVRTCTTLKPQLTGSMPYHHRPSLAIIIVYVLIITVNRGLYINWMVQWEDNVCPSSEFYLATLSKHILCVLDIYMKAGSELGLWWYLWYVLAGVGKYQHRTRNARWEKL